MRQGLEDAHPGSRGSGVPAQTALEDGRRRAVAEERGRDQVGQRQVGALDAQARQLDGHHQRAGLGKPDQKVVGARQRRRPARAAERGDRQPPDVGAKPELVAEVRVERGDHDPGARCRDDEIDVARFDARAGERLGGHLLPEHDGVLAIEALHLAEPARVSRASRAVRR